jgi:hypothetical protein
VTTAGHAGPNDDRVTHVKGTGSTGQNHNPLELEHGVTTSINLEHIEGRDVCFRTQR